MPPRPRPLGIVTLEEVKSQIDYDPETGIFTWKVRKPRVRLGARAGWERGPNRKHPGRRHIEVCGLVYPEAVMAWWYMIGSLPPSGKFVDHRNHDWSDNRWENLRLATQGQNYINSKTFGEMRGIQKRNSGKYRARITVDGKRRDVGTFDTFEEAYAARKARALELYGEFECDRR